MSYQIPTLKLQDYTMEAMLQKKLYLLLPFLFFNYEKQLGKASDSDVYVEIEKLFDTIIQRLKELAEKETLTAYEASTLYDALKVVVEALGKTHRAEKEVQKIMGGKILEFSADKYYNAGVKKGHEEGWEEGHEEGREEGRDEGRDEGKEEQLTINLKTVMEKLQYTAEAAMDFLNIPAEEHSKYALLLKESSAEKSSFSREA